MVPTAELLKIFFPIISSKNSIQIKKPMSKSLAVFPRLNLYYGVDSSGL